MIAPAAVSTPLPNLLDLTPADLVRELTALGQPAYRARQVLHWVYRRLVDDFAAMTDLPQALRRELAARFRLRLVEPLAELTDPDGTRKVLLGLTMDPAMAGVRSPQRAERWRRFNAVESVLMVYRPRGSGRQIRSVCVSTQVGCAMNCPFCATGQSGFVRDLTAGEIVAQVLYFARRLRETEGPSARITNVVFMGQGEPLANFENTWAALEALTDPARFGLGARHITVSTVGVVPHILELARRPLPVNLAVSLHAPNDDLRNVLVPLNRKYPLADLMAACREYIALTRRRITFEYTLMAGVNDSLDHMAELADLLRGLLCHVNLIPVNPTPGGRYQPPSPEHVRRLEQALRARGLPVTVRVERGQRIEAACGQLRLREIQAVR